MTLAYSALAPDVGRKRNVDWWSRHLALVISPIKALLYSAVLNGLVAPPLIVVLLFICNNHEIFGKNANGWVSNIFGWLAVALMSIAGGLLIWSLFPGKAA